MCTTVYMYIDCLEEGEVGVAYPHLILCHKL